jgi:hypothetical protein
LINCDLINVIVSPSLPDSMVFEHPLLDSIKISSWCYNFLSISRWVECQHSAFRLKMVGLALTIACIWPLPTSGLSFLSNLLFLFCSANTSYHGFFQIILSVGCLMITNIVHLCKMEFLAIDFSIVISKHERTTTWCNKMIEIKIKKVTQKKD